MSLSISEVSFHTPHKGDIMTHGGGEGGSGRGRGQHSLCEKKQEGWGKGCLGPVFSMAI